jgi:hypothetical protein
MRSSLADEERLYDVFGHVLRTLSAASGRLAPKPDDAENEEKDLTTRESHYRKQEEESGIASRKLTNKNQGLARYGALIPSCNAFTRQEPDALWFAAHLSGNVSSDFPNLRVPSREVRGQVPDLFFVGRECACSREGCLMLRPGEA